MHISINKRRFRRRIARSRKKETYVDYHAEAYYRALKRIEEERAAIADDSYVKKVEQTKEQKIVLFLKLLFCPNRITSELETHKFADTFLSFIVSGTLSFTGGCLRLSSLILLLSSLWGFYESYTSMGQGNITWLAAINLFVIALAIALIGSLFSIAGKELAEMENPEKLYSYSSGIMAALAVIIAIIGLFKQFWH